jgi:hypothetical protein
VVSQTLDGINPHLWPEVLNRVGPEVTLSDTGLCYTTPSRGGCGCAELPLRKDFERSLDTPESNLA